MDLPVGNKKKQIEEKKRSALKDMSAIEPAGSMTIFNAKDYEPEMCGLLLDAMSRGFDRKAAAGSIGVSMDTFNKWLSDHKDFAHAAEVGDNRCALFWQKASIENLTYQPTGRQINSKLYALNMAARFGWGEVKDETSKQMRVLAFEMAEKKRSKLEQDE